MSTLTIPICILLLLYFTVTIAAESYVAPGNIFLDCGSSSLSTSSSNQMWVGDKGLRFLPSADTSLSFNASSQDPSVATVPYSTARIFNTSSFTYTFPLSRGPKFLRLYFYPATYSTFNANQSFFSVSSNGYSLLTNFSAFQHVSFQEKTRSDATIVKEFLIHVNNAQTLNVVFTPSPNSYAFINGIEIISMPDNLYFNTAIKPKPVGMITGPITDNQTALENTYRLNMGGRRISVKYDTGMYRFWDQDDNYIYGAWYGETPLNTPPITYTPETPNYTAPETVYQTQRSMGKLAEGYNLTWILPVDSGFYYMLRLHFCNIIPQYTKPGQVIFTIFINNHTAEEEADLFSWTQGSGYPFFKDYVVFVNQMDGRPSKQDLWLALHPNGLGAYYDAYLNGLEVFKISMIGNLGAPNPDYVYPSKQNDKKEEKKTPGYATIIGGVGGGLVLLIVLLLILLWKHKRTRSNHNPLLTLEGCRHFTLKEVKAATNKFNDNCIVGNGGFGKVYRGHIDNSTKVVAIKRLSPSSNQGFQEFKTEIQLLSKLRHVHLVSLIGYCDENEEMILVYDYMVNGTLREHLYNTNNPPLPWKTRLNICIGAAKGLHYLHSTEKHIIIHRDVKSTNILLDENMVAKVSDFGLSKISSNDPSNTHVTTMVKGSIGYIDPEYRKSQHLRQKSDVYSFGVVLFEVLCARPVIDPWVSAEQVSLAEWGKICYQRGTLIEISDPNISGEVAVECLEKFGEVANSCLHEEGNVRPTMEEVVYRLEFALQLQVAADEFVGKEIMQEKQNEKEDQGNVALAKVSLNNGEYEESLVIELSTTLITS
uniref:receptor-like protein kinase FERONIA n=1 Tax=Erigeron canadensis TaxID=72917 RepID=UPI001CB8F11E|nr:receptor-like protein kinase FERONIA [Erigeron canadensis]